MNGNQGQRWALITGASSGIGRATAERLAEAGYGVVLVGRRAQALEADAERWRTKFGVPARVVVADFSDPNASALVDLATQTLPLEVAVLAAGFGAVGRFQHHAIESALDMIQVNCASVVALSHRLVARFRATGRGHLVLYGSIVGFGGVPHSAAYSATKNFVQAFAEGLQGELAGSGITVLCVSPGPTDTGFAARAGMRMGNAPGPEVVAKATVAAIGKNGTIRPGLLSKVLHYSLATLGRSGRSWMLGRIMQGTAVGVTPD